LINSPRAQNQEVEEEGPELMLDSNHNFQILPSNKPAHRRSSPRLSSTSLQEQMKQLSSLKDLMEIKVTESPQGVHPRFCACIVVNFISASYILLPHGT
jgi:hypothetical protein